MVQLFSAGSAFAWTAVDAQDGQRVKPREADIVYAKPRIELSWSHSMRTHPRYQHTQFGTVVVGSLVASAVVLAGLGLAYEDRVFILGGPIMMGIVGLLFYDLTVEIDATHLIFRFGIGLIRKRIPLAGIVEVRPVRNSWLYGWGIHRTPHGWLYNVSGWEAVEITLASGKRLRLGTDEPGQLTQVLRAAATRQRD
jgi:hypothetical protein